MPNSLPLVSVVITTKNEETNIANCIKSVKKQSFPPKKIEIIVVDNNSSDKTKRISKKYTKNVFNKGPERSAQRNYGIAKAKGKYILFLDSDMSLSKKVIQECVDKFTHNNENLVGLYIPERILGDSYWCKVRDFERSFYNGTVIDGLRFIKKDVLVKIKGFDEQLYACEDWDLDKRLKREGITEIIENCLYHNESDFELKRYLIKKNYYSKNFQVYINKWGKDDPDVKKQFGWYYRFIGVFIEKGKWVELLRQPILTISMYYIRFLTGINFLVNKVSYAK